MRDPNKNMIFRAHLITSFLLMFAISESNVEPTENYPIENLSDLIETHPEDLDLNEDDYVYQSLCKIVTARDTPFNIGKKQAFIRTYYRELHKCIEIRQKMYETSLEIISCSLKLDFDHFLTIFAKFFQFFPKSKVNWDQIDPKRRMNHLLDSMQEHLVYKIGFYTRWIYYPIECHANDWIEYFE